jgi:hypothetical protein
MNSTEKNPAKDVLRPLFVRRSAGRIRDGVWPVLVLTLFSAFSCGLAMAQQSSEQSGTGHLSNNPLRLDRRDGGPVVDDPETETDPVLEQKQLREMNAKLHKSIVSNTDKLQKMVMELNAEISGTNPASLTPEQLIKVAAIEKLAHILRNEMSSPIKEPPPSIDLAKPLPNYRDRR